jgi:hypothetical protein
MINNNQSNLTTSVPLTVANYTTYTGYTLFVSFSFQISIFLIKSSSQMIQQMSL